MGTPKGRTLNPGFQIPEVLEPGVPHVIKAQKHGPSGRIQSLVQMGPDLRWQQVDFGLDLQLIGSNCWILRSVTSVLTLEEHLPFTDNPRSLAFRRLR